jgi:hypothetical protein
MQNQSSLVNQFALEMLKREQLRGINEMFLLVDIFAIKCYREFDETKKLTDLMP